MTSTASPTLPESRRPRYAVFEARISALEKELRALDRRSAWFANARGLTFLLAAGLAVWRLSGGLAAHGFVPAGLALVAYVLLAVFHHRVFLAEEQRRIRVELNRRALARLDGGWHRFTQRGESYVDPAHLYTPDLDIFGQGSVFQLVDETATKAGEQRLAQWLSTPAPPSEVILRQAAVQELTPELDFRQGLAVACRLVGQQKPDPQRFLDFCEGSDALAPVRWARPLPWILPPLTVAAWACVLAGLLPRWVGWTGLGIQLLILVVTKNAVNAFYQAVSAGEHGALRFAPAFAAAEKHAPQSAWLRERVGHFGEQGNERVSSLLSRFERLLGWAELRRNQLHPVFNLLLLWDLQVFFPLERWRKEHGARARRWFESLADVEAAATLAGYAYVRPDHAWPKLVEEGPRIRARALGHPLLEAPVANDVELEGPSATLVVTGSNMSGKTTLLRALGVNAVLAQAGAPVCAAALELSPLAVASSMRVKDSLERGVSYFYAEVQRLWEVLQHAQSARGRCLFLLDEILLGTNTKERQIASREVLRQLLATGGIGALSTHDLALAELEREGGARVRNVHFRDEVRGGEMQFDYRLREGVVDTTNALEIMRRAGFTLP